MVLPTNLLFLLQQNFTSHVIAIDLHRTGLGSGQRGLALCRGGDEELCDCEGLGEGRRRGWFDDDLRRMEVEIEEERVMMFFMLRRTSLRS